MARRMQGIVFGKGALRKRQQRLLKKRRRKSYKGYLKGPVGVVKKSVVKWILRQRYWRNKRLYPCPARVVAAPLK